MRFKQRVALGAYSIIRIKPSDNDLDSFKIPVTRFSQTRKIKERLSSF